MLYGADVSRFQYGFDFESNRRQCPFVMIKQTEGLTWPDRDDPNSTAKLREMREQAQAAEYIWVGLYHFARPSHNRTGHQEAQHFIDFVGDLNPNEGVCLDFEANNGLDREELEQWAIDFVGAIEQKWPTLEGNVLFYCNPDFLANMSTDELVTRCPLWIAAYGSNNGQENAGAIDLDRWSTYAFWQFTSEGRLVGYDGALDVNRFEGTEENLEALCVNSAHVVDPPVPPPPIISQPEFVPEGWPGEYLRRGSEGIRVVQIQQRLARRGWNIGIDGSFGRATDTVVRKFQAEKGLEVDGIVGRETWDAMYAFFEGVDVMPAPIEVPPPVPDSPEIPPGEVMDFQAAAQQCAAWGFDGNAGLDPVWEFQRAFAWWPIAVDGSVGPQTAAAVKHVLDNGEKLSEHFAISELWCKHCHRIRFLRETLEDMEVTRSEEGPFSPVSAYRCPVHNANIGGASNGQHPMGAACDMNIPLSLARRQRYSGIGRCGDRCLHGDRRDASGNNTTGASPEDKTEWDYC